MSTQTVDLRDNELPKSDMSDNPTGCCPRFIPDEWDDRQLHFRDKRFVKAKTVSFLHIPLNMGGVFKRTFAAVEDAGAQDLEQFIVLSRDNSPWSADHFFSVTKDVPGQKMVRLSGDYRTKVFEGPFRNMGKWYRELLEISGDRNADTYFFYTTCPRCAKHYGKNYVVGLAGLTNSPPN